MWDEEIADAYDASCADMFEPAVVEPTVDLLAALAGDAPALEFAIGTGRIALAAPAPGSRRVRDRTVRADGGSASGETRGSGLIDVAIGDMATTRVPGVFGLVYLVFNTIMNVTTQDEQVAVFENAAAHLAPGGCFVVEVIVPQLRRVPIGEVGRVFTMQPDHVGIETFDDLVGQISSSHHWMRVDGRLVRHSAPYRYVWPSELDLMARLAGLRVRERWADWAKTPFTSDSLSQVAVFEKPTHPPER